MKLINLLLLLCALGLSSTAAYYSIAGLASIFSSAFWPVVVMATILEVSKLVLASFLYQKWTILPRGLRIYLTASVMVLMLITSLGIFGFLSKAHVDQGLTTSELVLRIDQLHQRRIELDKTISRYQTQLTQLDTSINIKLQNNRSIDADVLRKQQAPERTDIKTQLDSASAQIVKITNEETDLKSQLQIVESKVGPIKYIAEFFANGKEVDLDKAVRYMIIIIVMVFDPLAVLMLIGANISFKSDQQIITAIPAATLVEPEIPATAPTVDLDQLHAVIAESMDAWLNKALSHPELKSPDQTETVSSSLVVQENTPPIPQISNQLPTTEERKEPTLSTEFKIDTESKVEPITTVQENDYKRKSMTGIIPNKISASTIPPPLEQGHERPEHQSKDFLPTHIPQDRRRWP